jgi:hypothetical protein
VNRGNPQRPCHPALSDGCKLLLHYAAFGKVFILPDRHSSGKLARALGRTQEAVLFLKKRIKELLLAWARTRLGTLHTDRPRPGQSQVFLFLFC